MTELIPGGVYVGNLFVQLSEAEVQTIIVWCWSSGLGCSWIAFHNGDGIVWKSITGRMLLNHRGRIWQRIL